MKALTSSWGEMWEGGSGGQIGVVWLWGLWKGRFCEVLVVTSLVAPRDCHKCCPASYYGNRSWGWGACRGWPHGDPRDELSAQTLAWPSLLLLTLSSPF